jgi:hypothetical protein
VRDGGLEEGKVLEVMERWGMRFGDKRLWEMVLRRRKVAGERAHGTILAV